MILVSFAQMTHEKQFFVEVQWDQISTYQCLNSTLHETISEEGLYVSMFITKALYNSFIIPSIYH